MKFVQHCWDLRMGAISQFANAQALVDHCREGLHDVDSLRTSNSSAASRSFDATALVASHCGGATGLPRLFRSPTVETDGKGLLEQLDPSP